MADGQIPELLTQRLIHLLRLLDREASTTLREHSGLRILDWRILGSLGQQSPLTVRRLAELLFISRSEASRSAAVLIDKGLVERRDDPEDKRSCLFVITPAGQALYERIIPRRRAFINRIADHVPAEAWRGFNTTVDRLTDLLEAGDP